jgi:predicted amidophosphoribosyltransferase
MRFCSVCDTKLGRSLANKSPICPICDKEIWGPFTCDDYFSPYRWENGERVPNLSHNEFSKQILNNKSENDMASSFLSKILFEHIQGNFYLQMVDLIIPIPNFRSELQNVAAVSIALKYSELTTIPCNTNVLIKTKSTKGRKSGISREERMQMAYSSYDCRESFSIKNKKVLLVDDVLVGGSTTEYCAKLLLEHGARQVKIICLGRYVNQNDHY